MSMAKKNLSKTMEISREQADKLNAELDRVRSKGNPEMIAALEDKNEEKI